MIKKTKNCHDCGYPLIRNYFGIIFEGEMECPKCHLRQGVTTATQLEFIEIGIQSTTSFERC